MPHLQFKGKSAVETYHHTVPHHTLQFDKKLSVLDKGQSPALDGNLIIEGDNLLALKALLPTHAGKVKCIYIDPPYNTGEEQWVYNDKLTQPQFKEWIGQTVGKEGEDFCRHDKWCCMMYPRLQLLKELLREDGIIFISIDDIELSHLRMMMNEIFGEDNFIANVVWRKKISPDARQDIDPTHEYVMTFAKSSKTLATQGSFGITPLSEKRKASFKNPDNDLRGPWASVDMTGMSGRATKDQYFPVTLPSGRVVRPPSGRSWGLAQATFKQLLADNRIWFGKSGDGVPRTKQFLAENKGQNSASWWPEDQSGTTESATKLLAAILGKPGVFDFPKPLELISRLVSIINDPSAIVLDSFAGSGTTAHAVLNLNDIDNGSRKFILVQMPHDSKKDEKDKTNIAQKLTAVRVRRVIRGYKVSKKAKNGGDNVPGLGGTFTYTRLSEAPLFGDYRDLGDKLPGYDEIAAYVYYTETSTQWSGSDRRKNKAFDKKIGRIGEYPPEGPPEYPQEGPRAAPGNRRSYYLLYQPNAKLDAGLDAEFLKKVAAKDPNRELVVYCEKLWVHREHLRAWEREHGKRIRPMIVPFNLK